jgi:adenylate kinase
LTGFPAPAVLAGMAYSAVLAVIEPSAADRVDRTVGLVLVAGPPGSGKGTQCELLARAQGWGHLSSGDVFRDEIARRTPLGQQLDEMIDAGRLVPDGETVEVVLGALETWATGNPTVHNVLLDGFPRTLPQARALLGRASRYAVRLVIELVVPPSVSFDRLALRSRSDDDIAAIRLRLALYESETRPALDWLAQLGLLVTVDGDQPPEAVGTAIRRRLGAIEGVGAAPSPSTTSAAGASSA